MKAERENQSKCVCWIEIEVYRKTWDLSRKARISAGLLKMVPYANQLAGVIDLEERAGNMALKRNILRGNASDTVSTPMEEMVRSTIRGSFAPKILQTVEKNEQMTREQAKALVAFRTVSTDERGGDSLPIMVVQGKCEFHTVRLHLSKDFCPSCCFSRHIF